MKLFRRLFTLLLVNVLMFTCLINPVSAKENLQSSASLVETIQVSSNEITERYVVSSTEFQRLEMQFFKTNRDKYSQTSIGDFPWRSSTSYGSFESGDVATIAAALLSLGFPTTSVALTIASVLYKNDLPVIYYTSIYSQKRENGILYVKQEWKFYGNSARTQYITNYIINREYSDGGWD